MTQTRKMPALSRRAALMTGAAAALLPHAARAAAPIELTWEDLIPLGVPYGQIIGEGEIDYVNYTWSPIYDANATRLNAGLDGAYIRMPGFIIPLELSAEGVTEFVLVPYVGACIHVPPPPPNQLVFVTSETPWPNDDLWDAVWVTGRMRAELTATEIAETGYQLTAEHVEIYQW